MSIQSELLQKIQSRAARLGVIGLGYVGLPLATRAGRVGFNVLGFDVSAERAARLNAGTSYIGDVTSAEVAELRENGRFEATTDFRRLRSCDVVVICVPTPLNLTRDPDTSFIERAAQ
ncbi:UDP-N-acetyl-D-glucosamine dehydrogenase, partial [Kouleothrix aurantiaca]